MKIVGRITDVFGLGQGQYLVHFASEAGIAGSFTARLPRPPRVGEFVRYLDGDDYTIDSTARPMPPMLPDTTDDK